MISDWERVWPRPEGWDGEEPPPETEEPLDEDDVELERVDREIDRLKEIEDDASTDGPEAEPDLADRS